MQVPLTKREVEFVLGWKKQGFWPDEERVLRKLRQALEQGQPPKLSRLQVRIILGWAEEQLGGAYGGRVLNIEERSILDKLEAAVEVG